MTIASEISRLQNDKAAICTAIENKGVTVGNVTLDSYASCIDAIPTGSKTYLVDFMLVAGGGGGGVGSSSSIPGGGGGAGGVIIQYGIPINENSSVTVGAGGASNTNGCSSCFGAKYSTYEALGGGTQNKNGGSGGGAGYGLSMCGCSACGGNNSGQGLGHSGGLYDGDYYSSSGGGGGAGGPGCSNAKCRYGGQGILCNDFYSQTVACGGAGTTCSGGNGANASVYGGGGNGGGKSKPGGAGCQGIAIIRYPSDGSYGFTSATGGTKTSATIGGVTYCVHTFTSNGTFSIVS